jgi:pilus assembly protein CpaB
MKFAPKLPKLNGNFLVLGVAIALGIGALFLIQKFMRDYKAHIDAEERSAHKMVEVVVANVDLPRGAKIDPRAFAKREIPKEYVHSSAIDPQHFGQYVGQRLGAPMKHGEPLLELHLESTTAVFSSTLDNGNRALTTEVDEVNSISGMLRPSDHIDLMVTAHGTGKSTTDVTFPLLSNVEVLATGQITRKADGTNQSQTYTTITLSVSPEDAERIVVAKNSGKLTAVLRNPDDSKTNPTTAMNIDDVLPKKPNAAHRLPVQYIVGGTGH